MIFLYVFFFNDTATTEIYTLSLHDALPIWRRLDLRARAQPDADRRTQRRELDPHLADPGQRRAVRDDRSEEHTSELQSRQYLVCRLLLEKKKILSSILSLSYNIIPISPILI